MLLKMSSSGFNSLILLWMVILVKTTFSSSKCGTVVSDLKPFIFGGNNESVVNSPWHVAVYKVSTHTLICGGTLVTNRLIVSAAHCFFNEQKSTANNATNYEIIVSKYTRDYYTFDESQVKHKIHKIIVHENFDPRAAGHYGHDIAVVVLEKEIERTKFALPACVDWESEHGFKPAEGTLGKLAGWGIVNSTNEVGFLSNGLLSVMLPYISNDNCFGKVVPLPIDQFCAGLKSGTGPGPRQGDSGGGFMFQDPQNNLYYLRGIVSTGKEHVTKGANPQISAVFISFTDISHHAPWLSRIRANIDNMF